MDGLTRAGNVVTIKMEPRVRGGSSLVVAPISVRGEITSDYQGECAIGVKVSRAHVDSAASAWRERADSVWRQTRRSGPVGAALDSVRAWARAHPMTVSVTFDNEAGPDYSDLFREAPVIAGTAADSARLRAYAMQLRDWMAAKDTTALMGAYGPAIEDRYERTGWSSKEKYLRKNREGLVLANPILDFGREDVELRKWSGGRVWQIIRRGAIHDGFFREPSGLGIGSVYVAEINDSLHVVRQ